MITGVLNVSLSSVFAARRMGTPVIDVYRDCSRGKIQGLTAF